MHSKTPIKKRFHLGMPLGDKNNNFLLENMGQKAFIAVQ